MTEHMPEEARLTEAEKNALIVAARRCIYEGPHNYVFSAVETILRERIERAEQRGAAIALAFIDGLAGDLEDLAREHFAKDNPSRAGAHAGVAHDLRAYLRAHDFGGLAHTCNDPECHVPGFISTLKRKQGEQINRDGKS